MSDIEKKPSLRISPNVYGRTSVGNRVNYLINPKGEGSDMGVPETVVLTRWRQRKFPNYTFSGEKLSSTLWRAIANTCRGNAKEFCSLSIEQLKQLKEKKAASKDAIGHLKLPAVSTLNALICICGPERIQVLIDKHNAKDHEGKSGVPDLFLYAKNTVTGVHAIARFVEVKKPDEPISIEQKSEIALLNSMGLHARVIRLVEK
jgi:hypothetical protein